MNSEAPAKGRGYNLRRRVRPIFLGASIAVVLLVLAFARHAAEQGRVRAAIQRHLDAIRAAGQPVTGRELWASGSNPPPERNWHLAVEPLLMTNPPQAISGPGNFIVPLSEPTLASLSNNLRSNAVVLDFILRTDLTGMQWRGATPADPDDVASYRVPEIFKSIELCRVLGEKAEYEISTGHPDRATTALVKSFETAHVLRGMIIEAVGHAACETISLRALEATLKCGTFPEPDLLRLEATLPRHATNLLHQAIVQERVMGIWACELARDHPDEFRKTAVTSASGTGLDTPLQTLFTFLRRGFYRGSDYLGLLDRYARLERASLLPPREGLAVFRQVDGEIKALDPKRTSISVAFIEPKSAAFATQDAENRSRLVMARTALAVERWRLKHHGALPTNLEELVPDYLATLPLDPYDGQPVKLKPLPKGFTVYGSCQDSGVTNIPGSTEEGVRFTIER